MLGWLSQAFFIDVGITTSGIGRLR